MEWSAMETFGASFILGDMIDDTYMPSDDCEDVLEELLDLLIKDDPKKSPFRHRLALEKVVEKDIIPLIKTTQDGAVFNLAVRLFAMLTQPVDINLPGGASQNAWQGLEIETLITTAKHQCTDVAFFKSLSNMMKEILSKVEMDFEGGVCLNHCVLLLRNLLHMKSGTAPSEQVSIAHQCLLSSFFMNELDKIIVAMLKHKCKEMWTIAIAQLISFIFKDYSSSLLEPDIDDSTPASSADEAQDLVDVMTMGMAETNSSSATSSNLNSKFKDNLQICSSTAGESSQSLDNDDFMLEFNSTSDGQLEIKFTKCQQEDGAEEMKEGDDWAQAPDAKHAGRDLRNSSLGSDCSSTQEAEKEVMSSINSSSCLMDMDIFVSYLKKFATDIVYSGLVDLIENIMRAVLTTYENVFDHSFLIWTVGFFLSFAHQQELDFGQFKEILNLDLFGFLVYEGVKSSESLLVRHRQKRDCCVDKHRLHLIVCTLNQLFRTFLVNRKHHEAFDYLQNLQKCLSLMSNLHNFFVLLIRHHVTSEQSQVYLRDLVQTNHMLMLMVEEWVSHGYIGKNTGFSMLSHVGQFASKQVMAKYGSLLEHQNGNKEPLNIAVLTMMYHVAGDCKRQDTLIQIPILKAFSEIWMENAIREHNEFKDLIEFVLEIFMSDVEHNPKGCAQNLFASPEMMQQEKSEDSCSHKAESSGPAVQPLTEEEEVLIMTWTSETENCADIAAMVTRKLKEHGMAPSHVAVMKFLTENHLLPSSSSSPSIPTQSPWAYSGSSSGSSENSPPLHENMEILHQLSSVSEDNLIPFLLDKLRDRGFESHLVWLQKQLLEAAYVKLGIKEPGYRIHMEEPVTRFYALQGKSIPMVLWSDDLQEALTDPYFQLLQQSLGLYTCDDLNIVHPRIPHYMTPTLLVNKARQIGSIESLSAKFDVDTLKEESDIDIAPSMDSGHQDMEMFKPMQNMEFKWLTMIQKMNRGVGKSSG